MSEEPPKEFPKNEPIGTCLKQIFAECKIYPKVTCPCNRVAEQMDRWGIEESMKYKYDIMGMLYTQYRQSSYLDCLRVINRFYFSFDSLLNEAAKRARKFSQTSELISVVNLPQPMAPVITAVPGSKCAGCGAQS